MSTRKKTALEAEIATAADFERAFFEPDLVRLHTDPREPAREMAMLRRRAIYHAEQSKRTMTAHAEALARLAEAEREQARLAAAIGEYEKDKQDWFVPQLDSRAARIAELEVAYQRESAALQELRSHVAGREARIAALEVQVASLECAAADRGVVARLRRVLRLADPKKG